MNPTAISLAQACFQAALSSGTSTIPVKLNQLLTELSTDLPSCAADTEAVGHATSDEFPFLRMMISVGTPPDSAESMAWEDGVRGVLSTLRHWDSKEVNSLNKLCALLSAITALDAKSAGLSSVAAQVTSSQLISGLRQVIETADAGPAFNERRFPAIRQQIESYAKSGNLEQLSHMVPHMNFFPRSDFWAAVTFMYSADRAVLADIIVKRNDVLFSFMICAVLETHAIELALTVNSLIFKFVCVANCRQVRTTSPPPHSQHTLQTLLAQVAQTSTADWSAWMQALFKSPGNNASLDAALAAVIGQLTQEHWTAFFKALSLGYSHRAAAPVANILIPFANSDNNEQKLLMWATAYDVWSNWGYGQRENDYAMFAPAACALDFPVSMYYASQPSDWRLSEESNLLGAIETVEQQWFDSGTALITERNRLRSRLRLVQHGIALANGCSDALPRAIQPDADLYDRTRYHYHDLNL